MIIGRMSLLHIYIYIYMYLFCWELSIAKIIAASVEPAFSSSLSITLCIYFPPYVMFFNFFWWFTYLILHQLVCQDEFKVFPYMVSRVIRYFMLVRHSAPWIWWTLIFSQAVLTMEDLQSRNLPKIVCYIPNVHSRSWN